MAQPVEKEFAAKFAAALRTDKAHLAQIHLVKTRVLNEPQLLACLRYFCKNFDAATRMEQSARQWGLGILYTLFVRSTEIAGQLNDLVELLPAMESPQTADEILFASRWSQLVSNDQALLRQYTRKARQRLSDTRTLITPLIKAFIKFNKRVPGAIAELYEFDSAADSKLRPEFDRIANDCSTIWGKFNFHVAHWPPTEHNLDLLDAHFGEFTEFLQKYATDPLVFFQVLRWIREGGAKFVARVNRGQKFLNVTPSWSNIWQELYLDACFHAIRMAGGSWNTVSLSRAKGLPDDDYAFFIAPFPAGGTDRLQERLAARINGCLRDTAGAREICLQRRRNDRFAEYSGFQLLDEFDTVELENQIDKLKNTDPEALTKRYIRTASEKLVFNDRYAVGDSPFDALTIVWIEDTKAGSRAIVEFHDMSCVLFRMDSGHLRASVEKAFYKELAKNAEALKGFLLAYLEVLGLVMDVITAGASGGFRRVLFEFAKQQLKGRLIDKALDAAGVENELLRGLVQFGADFAHLPHRKPRTNLAAAEEAAITDTATDFNPKTQRATGELPPPPPPRTKAKREVPDFHSRTPVAANDYAPEIYKPSGSLEPADLHSGKPRAQNDNAIETPEPPTGGTGSSEADAGGKIVGAEKFAERNRQLARERQRIEAEALAQANRMKMASGTGGKGGDVVIHDTPGATGVDLPANGVARPATGRPNAADRMDSSIPRAVPAKSTQETVNRILGERRILNPRSSGKRWVEGKSLMDAETQRVLGETTDLRVAGTGAIDKIHARRIGPEEKLQVTASGIVLPDHLSRDATKVAKGARPAPNFNSPSPNNGFRVNEMQIRGARGESITMQRSHLWGPAMGDEAAAGMFMASDQVNLSWLNAKMESYVRNLANKAGMKGGFVRLEATATSWGRETSRTVGKTGEEFLEKLEYRFELHMPGQPVRTGHVTLDIPHPLTPDIDMQRFHALDFADALEGEDLMKYVK